MKRIIVYSCLAILVVVAYAWPVAEQKKSLSKEDIATKEAELIKVVQPFSHGMLNMQYDYRNRDVVVEYMLKRKQTCTYEGCKEDWQEIANYVANIRWDTYEPMMMGPFYEMMGKILEKTHIE